MHKPLVKRQIPVTATVTPTASGVSGGATASSDVNPGSSLLLGSSGSPTNLLTTEPGVTSSSTPNTSSSSSSNNSPPALSTGSVIAITVSVFVVLIGAMFLIYTYINRRTTPQARHPLSRGAHPAVRGAEISRDHGKDKQRNNSGERGEGKNNSSLGSLNRTGVRARSPDSARFALFEKDPSPSIRSVTDEKAGVSTSDDHHFDPSTMASFAKYQVGHVDDFSALSRSSPLGSHEGGSPPISWDGGTVIGDQFASLHASVSDTMSPTAVSPTAVVIRQTPLTTDSEHRWESAEVVMMDEATTEPMSVYSDVSQDPVNDDAAPRRSTGSKESVRRSNSNPFFNASQHERSTRSRASSVSTATAKRSRSYSASSNATVRGAAAAAAAAGGPESENALVSLLAALRPTPVVSDEQNNRSSMRTTLTSLYTPAEGHGGADPTTPQAF